MAEPQPIKAEKKEEQQQKPAESKAAPSENPIVNLIDGALEKTSFLSAVDPDSQYNPWNTDDLYQKEGNYSIYEAMMQDDQVSVAMAVKKDLIIGSGWKITCEEDGQEDIKADLELALTEDMEASLDDCLSDMLTAYDIGFSVTEKQFKTRDDGTLTVKNLKTRNPVSWLFHQDKFGNVTRYEQQGTTKEFSDIDPNSLIHFVNNPRYGKPYGTSDLRAAYTAYFVKKQIIKFYGIFMEKAASPVPVAKYDKNTALETDRLAVFNAIKKLQTSSAMVVPKDFEIEFLQSSGNGEAYIKGINLFNMFIGRALFVPDLLGFQGGETSGGSQALGREQMVVFFKHIMRRRRTLENIINHHIVKPLVIWNHGFQENYPKFKLNPIEEQQATENARLWLEAVKGKAIKPNLAEINHFKSIVDFPETTEEEFEQQQQDAIDEAAAMAESLGGKDNPDGEVKKDEKEGEKKAEKDEGQKGKGDKPAKFAKTYQLPTGSYHKKTDFKAIETQLDSNLDLFVAKATPLIKDIFSKFAARLQKVNTGKAQKLETLEKLTLPKPELRRLEKLLDQSFLQTFEHSMDRAREEIYKSEFGKHVEGQDYYVVQAAPEFLKTLEEEDYNFIKDWEYALTKKARGEIIAAVKDGKPISAVLDVVATEGAKEAFTAIERYARTKFTEVMNKGRLEYFKSTGVIAAYQYSAVLDGQTSDVCSGLHGKVFKAGSEPVPPMHFNCRSLLVPITSFEEWKADEKVGSKGIDDFIDEHKGKGFARN
jgi:SPP1 gp7 family putative phage head morphogenesis protein